MQIKSRSRQRNGLKKKEAKRSIHKAVRRTKIVIDEIAERASSVLLAPPGVVACFKHRHTQN